MMPNGREEVVSIDHLKPAYIEADLMSTSNTAPHTRTRSGRPVFLPSIHHATKRQPVKHDEESPEAEEAVEQEPTDLIF